MVYKVTNIGKIHKKQKSLGINWAGAAILQLLLPGLSPLVGQHTAGGAGTAQTVRLGLKGAGRAFTPKTGSVCALLGLCPVCACRFGIQVGMRVAGAEMERPHCAGFPGPWDGLGDTQHSQSSPASNTKGMHRAPLAQLCGGAAFTVRSSFRFCCTSPTPLGSLCMCRISGVGFPQLDVGCPAKLLYQCPLQLERGEKIKGEVNTGRDPSLVTITGTTA